MGEKDLKDKTKPVLLRHCPFCNGTWFLIPARTFYRVRVPALTPHGGREATATISVPENQRSVEDRVRRGKTGMEFNSSDVRHYIKALDIGQRFSYYVIT